MVAKNRYLDYYHFVSDTLSGTASCEFNSKVNMGGHGAWYGVMDCTLLTIVCFSSEYKYEATRQNQEEIFDCTFGKQ